MKDKKGRKFTADKQENITDLSVAKEEYKALRKLAHPNIVSCLECYSTAGTNVFITIYDFCPYGDLAKGIALWVKQGKPVPEEIIFTVMVQACTALKFAHSRNVIH